MIRINLAVERARPKVKRPVAVPGGVLVVFILIALVAGAAALGAHYYLVIQPGIVSLQQEKTKYEDQRAELARVEQEIKAFEEKRQLLEGRINVINTLRGNQTGPVRMLEAVGNTVSLTETLWLTSMAEKTGGEIEFKGTAGSVDAVANFITNLNRSGFFQNVEIKESVQKPGTGGVSDFEFTLTAKFALPAQPAATPAAGGQT